MAHRSFLRVFFICPLLASAAVLAPRQGTAPSPWVTVDLHGNYATVLPTVTESSTLSAPPAALTQISTHVLTVSGTTTTSTGTPPLATVSGPGLSGSFLLCDNYQGADRPFCLPRSGSSLSPGSTYFVTWDPSFFGVGETLEFEVQYDNGEGFTTSPITASAGFVEWTIQSNFLSEQKLDTIATTLYLTYIATLAGSSNETVRATGPTVYITDIHKSSGSHVPIAAIVVPVVVGVLVIALAGFCLWHKHRNGRFPLVSKLPSSRPVSFSAKGYGVRQSYVQRTGTSQTPDIAAPAKVERAVGIQLTDRDSWSPTRSNSGTNVFRDELRRQEQDERH